MNYLAKTNVQKSNPFVQIRKTMHYCCAYKIVYAQFYIFFMHTVPTMHNTSAFHMVYTQKNNNFTHLKVFDE